MEMEFKGKLGLEIIWAMRVFLRLRNYGALGLEKEK